MRPIFGLIVLAFLPLAVAHTVFLLSLPELDGKLHATDLSRAVTVDRDRLGIPTIVASSRPDLAYATGFVHAQDRFFQMDLARRFASGDLVSLVGTAAASHDKLARTFQFRRVARKAFATLAPAEKQVLKAYTAGVNAGLAALPSRPWEYWILRHRPIEWSPEDALLVVYSMWWDLQYGERGRDELRLAVNDRLSGPGDADGWKPATRFLFPARTRWDAPVDAAPGRTPSVAIPDSSQIDLRRVVVKGRAVAGQIEPAADPPDFPGSNNWALDGAHTGTHAALVASDMHLRLGVPTIWYRARLRLVASRGGASLDLNGVTLPGAPLLVAGSNGSIAWGFTNSNGHWLDVDPQSRSVHWLATNPEATNLRLMALETAKSTDEALRVAPTFGIPQQNMIVGDRDGNIGWTIAGRIPRDKDWARHDGVIEWLTADDAPRIVNPADGRLWSANARVIDNEKWQALIGGSSASIGAGYDLGARAKQIRDDLISTAAGASPRKMLEIQLDDRAVLMSLWRERLLSVLGTEALAGHAERAELERLVRAWDPHASTDSVGYRIVRTFRDQTRDTVWQSILQSLGIESAAPADAQFEEPLARLLEDRPDNFLPARFSDWDQLLLGQVDATIDLLKTACGHPAACTWGRANVVRIRHPLSAALPFLADFLDMPQLQLSGDQDMPRVQHGTFGASERLAVSPGHEPEGLLSIAGGQSAHPLSPYYRAGFREWASGTPVPLLPGESQHRLTLVP